MPDLGEHVPDANGNCEGCPSEDPDQRTPWPCGLAWSKLRGQYQGPLVVLPWPLCAYLASQLVWAGQRMPDRAATDIAVQVIRHLEPRPAPAVSRDVPGVPFGANSRFRSVR